MKAKSIKGKSTEEIKIALDESVSDGFKPTLAIVFMSIKQNLDAICELLTHEEIQIFGATSSGEFISSEIEEESIVIMLLDIHPSYFKLMFLEAGEHSEFEIAKQLGEEGKKTFANAAFIITSGWNKEMDGEEILKGIEEGYGNGVNIFGGMAGDDLTLTGPKAFSNDKKSTLGLAGLIIDEDRIDITGVATCGWKAVGTEKTVTKSEGNHVFTIDDSPALDITTKYGGLENITPENKNLLVEIAANFPLQLQREKGDPVMRPALVVDWEDHSFYTSGSVPQGSKIRFSLPPDWDVMEKVVKGVQNLKETEMPEADALVVFSCAGRILSFGPMMNAEIEGVKEVWDVPMAGMFSNAELGRMAGGNLEMHNLTTCCVALKEK